MLSSTPASGDLERRPTPRRGDESASNREENHALDRFRVSIAMRKNISASKRLTESLASINSNAIPHDSL